MKNFSFKSKLLDLSLTGALKKRLSGNICWKWHRKLWNSFHTPKRKTRVLKAGVYSLFSCFLASCILFIICKETITQNKRLESNSYVGTKIWYSSKRTILYFTVVSSLVIQYVIFTLFGLDLGDSTTIEQKLFSESPFSILTWIELYN